MSVDEMKEAFLVLADMGYLTPEGQKALLAPEAEEEFSPIIDVDLAPDTLSDMLGESTTFEAESRAVSNEEYDPTHILPLDHIPIPDLPIPPTTLPSKPA